METFYWDKVKPEVNKKIEIKRPGEDWCRRTTILVNGSVKVKDWPFVTGDGKPVYGMYPYGTEWRYR